MRAPVADPRAFSSALHRGFDRAGRKHRMGLRRVEPGAWLEPDAHRAWQLDQKARLVAEDRGRFVHPESTDAAAQGAGRLAELLAAEPGQEALSTHGPASVIERCGLATQEDWCVMVREDTWRLRAACVCFPSRWVLADKVGGTVAAIHDPVPRYEQDLGGLLEASFDRMPADRAVWRVNWNLWDDPRLSQPWTEADAEVFDPPPVDEVGERVFVRVERQTMRRLTDDAIAFSIRVHQRPLARLVDEEGAIDSLRTALAGVAAGTVSPKELGHLGDPVTAWLAAVAPGAR
jgi:hypothetical protein